MKISSQNILWRPAGAAVIASLTLPTLLVGCGSPAPQAQAPMQRAPQARPANAGMSTRQKVTLLAGAAAMYYLYRKYQRDNAAQLQQIQAQAPGGKIQYYRSKKGGYIYYRDPRNPQVAIKIPGTEQGVEGVQQQQVSGAEANQYSQFQGYNNAPGGETLDKYFPGSITALSEENHESTQHSFGQLANSVQQHSSPNTPGPEYDANPILGALSNVFGQHAQQTGQQFDGYNPNAQYENNGPNIGGMLGGLLGGGGGLLGGLLGGGGGNQGQQSSGGVQSSDADPYGDPENQGGASYGNVQSSDADPYGDPENQR